MNNNTISVIGRKKMQVERWAREAVQRAYKQVKEA